MRLISFILLALVLTLLPFHLVSAQSQEGTTSANVLSRADVLPKQLDDLNTKRRDALEKVLSVGQEIFKLQQEYVALKEYVRGNLGEDTYKQIIKALQNVKAGSATADDYSLLDVYRWDSSPQGVDRSLTNVKKTMEEELRKTKRYYEIEGVIKAEEEKLFQARQDAAKIENQISSIILETDEENEFRLIISLMFTGLVAFVIAGFYVMAYKNNVVANAFGGEKGIQFITLFLVVIAIILFGIMGVFGGKELSALLGALSGYILGRSTSGKSGGDQRQNAGGSDGGSP